MKIPYSFIQKCNELNVDLSTCSITAYNSYSLIEKNIFFDIDLTIKLKNPIKLNAINLENINLSSGAYRLIIKDQNSKTLLDEFNVLGISSGGDINPSFDAIKNSSGVTQFNATTLNKSISFAASGTVSLSFDAALNKITIIGQTGTYSAGTAIKIATGVISVGNIVNGGLLVGSGANNDANILVPGITYNSLVIGENGLPSWGTINLTSNSAVSGILSISNGGTGLPSLGTLGIAILSYSSSSSGLLSWNGSSFSINTNTYLTSNQSITLSGDVTGSGATAITTAIASSVVTGKLLTGYVVGSNTAIAATDTILGAFGKVQAQINSRITLTSLSAISPILYNNSTGVISHASTDGNLHVPATSTTNNGKVLTAGATAGSLSWTTPTTGTVTSVGLSAPSIFTVSGSPVTSTGTLTFAWNGSSANLVRADGSTVAASTYLTPSNVSGAAGQVAVFTGTNTVGSTDQIAWSGTTFRIGSGATANCALGIYGGTGTTATINLGVGAINRFSHQLYIDETYRWVARDATGVMIDFPLSMPLAAGSALTLGRTLNSRVVNIGSGYNLQINGTEAITAARAGNLTALTVGSLTGTLVGTSGLVSALSGTNLVLGNGTTIAQSTFATSTDLTGYLPLTAGSGKALTGTLYGSNLNFTSTTDSPLLITHNLAGAFTHPLQAFNSGMVAGNQYNFDFGRAASNYNSGNFGYKYVGAGSTSNYITLGLYGANDLLKITGAGVATFSGAVVTPALSIGTLSGTLIGTSGVVSALSGTGIVLGNGTTIPQSTFTSGSGTSGVIAKWIGAYSLNNSILTENSGYAGINNAAASWPAYSITETSQGTDAKNWAIRSTSSSFVVDAFNDAWTSANRAVSITRTGYVVGNISLQSSSVNLTALTTSGFVKTNAAGLLSVDTNTYALSSSLGNYLPLASGSVHASGTYQATGPTLAIGDLQYGLSAYGGYLDLYSNNGVVNIYSRVGGNNAVLQGAIWHSGNLTPAAIGALAVGGTAVNSSALGGVGSAYFVQGNGAGPYGHRTTNVTSFNTLLPSGFYDNSNGISPLTTGWTHMIRSAHSDPSSGSATWSFDIAANFYTPVNGHQEGYYVRVNEGSSWGTWRTLWHSGNLTPAAIGAAPAHSLASNVVLRSNGSGGFAASQITDAGSGSVSIANNTVLNVGSGAQANLMFRGSVWWTAFYAGATEAGFRDYNDDGSTNSFPLYWTRGAGGLLRITRPLNLTTGPLQIAGTDAITSARAGNLTALTVGSLTGTLVGTSGIVSALSGTGIVLGNGTTIPQSTFATAGALGNYLPLSGGTMAGGATITLQGAGGGIILPGYGTSGMFMGNADNATFSAYNLKIKSWWGIGFESYNNVTRTVLDTRTGNFSTLGGVYSSIVSAGGATLREYVGGTDYYAIYGNGAGTPSSNNYSFCGSNDGTVSWVRGATQCGLVTSRGIIATATSTGLSVTGDIYASSRITANNAQMSKWDTNGDFARFGHSSWNSAAGFGYIQHSSGTIYLEAPAGTSIHQRINNAELMIIDSETTTVYNNLAVSTGSVTISGGSLVVNGTWFRDQVGNTIKSCIYMPNLSGGAGVNNYSFMARKDGQFAFINGSSAVGLDINNVDILLAYADRLEARYRIEAPTIKLGTQRISSSTAIGNMSAFWVYPASGYSGALTLPSSPSDGCSFGISPRYGYGSVGFSSINGGSINIVYGYANYSTSIAYTVYIDKHLLFVVYDATANVWYMNLR